ncbi:MAG: hypothetical protein NVS2B7_26950 [Herpetosiphon sp.]
MYATPSLLQRRLKPFGRRLRLRDTVDGLQRTAWTPGLAMLLIQLAGHIVPIAHLTVLSTAPLAAWLLLLAIRALAWRQPSLTIARRVDQILDLRERFATALEIGANGHDGPLNELQLSDAEATAVRLVPHQIPLNWHWRSGLLFIIPVAATVALILLPNGRTADLQRRADLVRVVAAIQQTVAEQQRQIEANTALPPDQRASLLTELQSLQQALKTAPSNPEEILARLSAGEGNIRSAGDPAALARQVQMAQVAKQNPIPAVGAPTKPLSQQLAELKTTLDGQSAAEQTRVAQTLDQQAAALASGNPTLAQHLSEGAAALRAGKQADAQRSIEQAGVAATDVEQRAAAQAAREQTLSRLESGREQVTRSGTNQPATAGAAPGSAPAVATANAGGPSAAGPAASPAAGQSNASNAGASAIAAAGQPGTAAPLGGQSGTQSRPGASGNPSAASGNSPGASGNPPGAGGQAGGNGTGRTAGGGGGSNASTLGNNTANGGPPAPGTGAASTGSGSRPGSTTLYQPFTPRPAAGQNAQLPGEKKADGGTVAPGEAAPGLANEPLVPYEQVYGNYRSAAADALDGAPIPPGLKDYVRDYFSQLDPGR